MYQNKAKKADNSIGTVYVNKPVDGKPGYLNISIDLAALGVGTGTIQVKAFKNDFKKESKHPDYRILKPLPARTGTSTAKAAVASTTDDSDLPF